MTEQVTDIDVLIPDVPTFSTSTGLVLEFHKFKWKETKQILKLLQKYFRVVADPSEENIRYFAAGLGEEVANDIAQFISILVRKTPEETTAILDELYIDEVLSIFVKSIQVNVNFFKEQLKVLIPAEPVEAKTGA